MATISERLTLALADRYRIERELGAGGMATVYLADDLRHHRKVALKVMRPELAAVIGADRFLAEITTTANLQHPHILPLFDSGTVDGTVFYVMPLVDGETLRERLAREKQLPIDDAVRIATEVAGALHYAHAHGVIHRDIKPENILLHGGHALVADFGIALAAATTGGSRMTETGMSLGTPTYMSPEQAMGERTLDARTDIYALGCVLYEMLVGDPPYTGSTAQAVVAKIITEKPASIVAHRDRVPVHIEDAVLTALEKLPADRFANAAEFASALGDRAMARSRSGQSSAAPEVRTRRGAPAGLMLAIVAIVAASTGWLARSAGIRDATPEPIRFATSLGLPGMARPHLSISSDGRRIMQTMADSAGTQRLVVRDLGSNTLTTIPGTEQAQGGEFSPNGDWIAFTVAGQLRKVSAQGGPTTTLIDSLRVESGVAWTSTGDIIFSARNSGLWRVSADGGTPVQITKLDTARKEFGHWFPQMLPGGKAMIYTSYAARPRIEAYDFDSGRMTVLADGAVFGRYSPTGHLLYARDAAVFAIDFDADRLDTSGAAVPVQDDVAWEATNALAGYAISPNGTFVYLRDSDWSADVNVVWRDRAGRDVLAIDEAGAYREPRLSPDGKWIAFTLIKPKQEVWLYDLARRVPIQLTRAPMSAFHAAWMPDSRRIVYTYEAPVYDLHMIPIDASAPDQVVMTGAFDKYVSSITSDGRRMLVNETTSGDRLLIATLDGKDPPRPLTVGSLEQRAATFSPDDRWIAFSEHGDARADIYIRAANNAGGRILVSAGGGFEPRWTKGGREIVYLTGTAMMSVAVDAATGEVGAPMPLFSVLDLERSRDGRVHSYDVSADGERFLVVRRITRPASQPVVVTLNWRPEMGQAAAVH